VKDYATARATAYHRFLTLHWGNVERGGPPGAGDWTEAEATRLGALVDHAHGRGYRVRFYCLDGRPVLSHLPYRFADLGAARVRWLAAARAKVDWIASDDDAEIVRALRAGAR
jgi:hypothetical protein